MHNNNNSNQIYHHPNNQNINKINRFYKINKSLINNNNTNPTNQTLLIKKNPYHYNKQINHNLKRNLINNKEWGKRESMILRVWRSRDRSIVVQRTLGV